MIGGVEREQRRDRRCPSEGTVAATSYVHLFCLHAEGNVVDLAAIREFEHRRAVGRGRLRDDEAGQAFAEIPKAIGELQKLLLPVEVERGATVEARRRGTSGGQAPVAAWRSFGCRTGLARLERDRPSVGCRDRRATRATVPVREHRLDQRAAAATHAAARSPPPAIASWPPRRRAHAHLRCRPPPPSRLTASVARRPHQRCRRGPRSRPCQLATAGSIPAAPRSTSLQLPRPQCWPRTARRMLTSATHKPKTAKRIRLTIAQGTSPAERVQLRAPLLGVGVGLRIGVGVGGLARQRLVSAGVVGSRATPSLLISCNSSSTRREASCPAS